MRFPFLAKLLSVVFMTVVFAVIQQTPFHGYVHDHASQSLSTHQHQHPHGHGHAVASGHSEDKSHSHEFWQTLASPFILLKTVSLLLLMLTMVFVAAVLLLIFFPSVDKPADAVFFLPPQPSGSPSVLRAPPARFSSVLIS